MARRRRQDPLTPTVVRARVRPVVRFPALVRNLRDIEDRRLFHPAGPLRPASSFSRRDQRRIVEKSRHVAHASSDPFPSLRLGFAVPQKVAKCVRRKQRREALFAFKKTGSGAKARRRRRDHWSDVSC